MIENKKIEQMENSSIKLTVTVKKEAVKKGYDDLLTKYTKTAHIKGFRKGKVPAALLEQKFGDGLKEEASMNIVDESLKTVFAEIDEKPLYNSIPEFLDQENFKVDLDKDLTFAVKYDIFPTITPGIHTGLEIEEPDVKVTKKDEDRELETLRDQNSVVIEKKEGTVEKDDIVTINYHELEDGQEKEGTKREDFVFTVGSGQNLYKLDDDVIGMKKDEEKTVEKEDGESKKISVCVKVTAVKVKQLPELDDELAQDVDEKYETLADLRKDLGKRLRETLADKVKQGNISSIIDKIVEGSKIELPETMIKSETESRWKNYIAQFQTTEDQILKLLAAQQKTKEEFLTDWRPDIIKQLKSQLVVSKLVELEKIEVSDEEYETSIKERADSAERTLEEIKEYIKSTGMGENLKFELKSSKLFDLLIEKNTIKKGKKTNFLDLMQKNY